MADGGDTIDNGHQDIANSAEDALNTADYGTHCDMCVSSVVKCVEVLVIVVLA